MGFEEVVDAIATAAHERGTQIAVAESLTCGTLVKTLGLGENSSEWLAGAVVAYQTRTKIDVLGLEPGTDPCSPECAERLAVGVRELLGADLAVSTTGVGGPGPDGGHEAGTVYVGWSTARGHGHRGFMFDGDPDEVLEQTVGAALHELVARLDAAGPGGSDVLR